MISITLPTYNEKENLRPLVERIATAMARYQWEVLVVDDNSQDGTSAEALELAKRYPVKVLVRQSERGLASAILHGFRNSDGEVLVAMDSDLQHPPEYLPEIVGAIEQGAQIAVASRHVPGGRIEGFSSMRKLLSKGATLLARPLTPVKDPMSGYFAVSREVVERRVFDPSGFKLLLEILADRSSRHLKVTEVPYTFMRRKAGSSKLGLSEIGRYIRLLCRLYRNRLRQ